MPAGGYKILNQDAAHFITFSVVGGVDVLPATTTAISWLIASGTAKLTKACSFTAGAS
jgi:hypothetical protein